MDGEVISSIVFSGMGDELSFGRVSCPIPLPCFRQWRAHRQDGLFGRFRLTEAALNPLACCPSIPCLQRVFKIDQADWMRNTHYDFFVSATNDFCESGNSSQYEFDTP